MVFIMLLSDSSQFILELSPVPLNKIKRYERDTRHDRASRRSQALEKRTRLLPGLVKNLYCEIRRISG